MSDLERNLNRIGGVTKTTKTNNFKTMHIQVKLNNEEIKVESLNGLRNLLNSASYYCDTLLVSSSFEDWEEWNSILDSNDGLNGLIDDALGYGDGYIHVIQSWDEQTD